ncbi:ADC synthase [Podospora appendiculata]|uniref:aminodeoxychorismate synthase n=1 Tax=Podospora appendiculata TaxID=314037 RepID=A0AAE0X5J7_9PEZI|nr:ADC synthase [Podospora appendiculata]
MTGRRPRILFLDAYDSFSNNITALLTTLLDVDVFVLPIDSPLLPRPTEADFGPRLRHELSHYAAVVCGPGPGAPGNDADVGLMKHIWQLRDADLLPVLGICLGFQSLVASCGGTVRRLRRGLHGMVREIVHRSRTGCCDTDDDDDGGGDVFHGVGRFKATLYHSLCGDIGQQAVPETEWREARWRPSPLCPDLVPLAWVEEDRGDGDGDGASSSIVERILMGVRHRTRPFWGLQYHPESVCTDKEGNRVIVNWFREAQQWNQARGRVASVDGGILARNATKPSLLSQLPAVVASAPGQQAASSDQWWESMDVGNVYHSMTIPLPHGVQVPDIVEVMGSEDSERIILDSANAATASARTDVRGRYSIIATGLENTLRIEYHTGDDYATLKLGSIRGESVGLSQQVPLAPYGTIWGFVASFHEARHIETTEAAQSPFLGGFMGYITYEQGLSDIGIFPDHDRQHHRPDVCLAWVTKSIAVDHVTQMIHIQQLVPQGLDMDMAMWVEKITDKLMFSPNFQTVFHNDSFSPRKGTQPLKTRRPSRGTSTLTPMTKEYENKVSICQEFIAAGDSYELCLTDQTKITRPMSDLNGAERHLSRKRRRSSLPAPPSSWSLFKSLRTRQPAPFASYIRLGGATLVSASPERFLQYDDAGRCSMRPMKGTVRKSEEVATLAQAEKILHVPKEEAENLMIVDLVRHDLHAICGAGNVTVPHLLVVEEYQSVFTMITVVEGQLPTPPPHGSKYTGLDVLAASLPPGSMTGAPKKRSCEILQQLEHGLERSLYSGVVGYMCATGRGDWSVTIRSLFRWDDEQQVVGSGEDGERHEVWRIGAGGAVTILSTPEGEREEMFTKLAGPLRVFADSG